MVGWAEHRRGEERMVNFKYFLRMLSVGNKGPESLKTEIHLITEELPSPVLCPVFQHVLGRNDKKTKY